MEFKDLFSKQAKEYVKYRPTYPPELFSFLSSISPSHKRAWDCATGNGQAAAGLVPYFDEIIATDLSQDQINNAVTHPKIKFYAAPAEKSGLENASCDLVTAATAVHWFNLKEFYEEVKRVLKPGGIIAVWIYFGHRINKEVDTLVNNFFEEVISPYRDRAITKAINFDKEMYFPFEEVKAPQFTMKHNWSADDFIRYLYTWSSVQTYIAINKSNPLSIIEPELKSLWKEEKRFVEWELFFKAGKV